jgi:hypothetical protein
MIIFSKMLSLQSENVFIYVMELFNRPMDEPNMALNKDMLLSRRISISGFATFNY